MAQRARASDPRSKATGIDRAGCGPTFISAKSGGQSKRKRMTLGFPLFLLQVRCRLSEKTAFYNP
jgi:hypothetical protein